MDFFFLSLKVFFIFLVSLGAHSEEMCTQMACESGLFLDFPTGQAWKSGSYQFNFNLDGKKVRCNGKLPLKSCEESSMECDSVNVSITESGCALPSKVHGWGRISIIGAPKVVDVTIKLNKKIIASYRGSPQYQEARPNGKNCTSVCSSANIMMKNKK